MHYLYYYDKLGMESASKAIVLWFIWLMAFLLTKLTPSIRVKPMFDDGRVAAIWIKCHDLVYERTDPQIDDSHFQDAASQLSDTLLSVIFNIQVFEFHDTQFQYWSSIWMTAASTT